MANFHSRSNSFPSQSNTLLEDDEDQLCRLISSQSTSTSPNSICSSMASLTDLHQRINNLIQMPSAQQALSQNGINELLEESIRLMDLCGFTRDVVCSTKESVQELESSIRRSRGNTDDHINAYLASKKKINKMIKKSIKNFKSLPARDADLKAVDAILKETESLDFSILKSVLALISGEKEGSSQRSWSLISKITQKNRVHYEEGQELCSFNIHKSQSNTEMLKQLNSAEMIIQEIEEGLESLFRTLVKTRVSLLNLISH